jgi:hypothetical protein
MWWPKLEVKITKILEDEKVENTTLRTDRELLEEVLALSRITAKLKNSTSNTSFKINNYSSEHFERLVSNLLWGTESIFQLDWDHTKTCLDSEVIRYFVSPDGDFLNPGIDDESNNWANRPLFLDAYRKLNSFMTQHKIFHSPYDNEFDMPF